jgi:uncharacterized repeat protein (TIGR03806 family)
MLDTSARTCSASTVTVWGHRALRVALACVALALAGRATAQSCNLPPLTPFAGHNFPLDSPPVSQAMTPVEAFPSLPSFTHPVFVTAAPDGSNRLFVIEQPGVIRVFQNDPAASSTSVFLDIQDLVDSSQQEMGLLGMAFDPAFATNHYFYVNFTTGGSLCEAGSGLCTRIARFTVPAATPNAADKSSLYPILEYAQPYGNHKGGMMAFGPDGYLWISAGDGGAAGDPNGNGQNTNALLGKMLRIDPSGDSLPADPRRNYRIPPTNPFASGVGGKPEWWARGMRNPWRWSFDRLTGDLVIGDVGQDAYEEVDFLTVAQRNAPPAGGYNFGWNICEGFHAYNGANCAALGSTPPIIEYPHTSSGGYSITGGYVYRGDRLPALYGAYIYADYVSGNIWSWNGVLPAAPVQIANMAGISSFGEDQNGELYEVALAGRIYRLDYNNTPPVPFPSQLSATGLFANTAALTPAPGLVEYDVNTPLWSDRALKRRWVGLPAGKKAHFKADGAFDFPVGTVLVKHFELPLTPTTTTRLETRVFLRQVDRWTGFTYQWNPAQTDATLLDAGATASYQVDPNGTGTTTTQVWNFPSQSQCLGCHSAPENRVLGPRAVQLNRSFNYPSGALNQIDGWSCLGMFDNPPQASTAYAAYAPIGDGTRSVQARARSYLGSNCAICHQPLGPAPSSMDLRSKLLLGELNAIGVAPSEGDLGLPSPQRIKVGVPEQSILWHRQQSTDPTIRMPFNSTVPDPSAVALFDTWIRSGLASIDSDEDGIPDASDNCPRTPNANQRDGGSFNGTSVDGIGDACQCGDVTGDGTVTNVDATRIRTVLVHALPRFSGDANRRCDSPSDTGECTIVSWARIRKRISGATAAHDQSCAAATVRQP